MKRKLKTIQKHDNLNEVWVTGERGPGNAYHDYLIIPAGQQEENPQIMARIEFQKGPRDEEGSRPGVLDSDLLEIVRDRLRAFQSGPYACEYNEQAILHVEKALKFLNYRAKDRKNRGVLGKNKK